MDARSAGSDGQQRAAAPSDPLDDFLYREGEEAPGMPDLGAVARPPDPQASQGRREFVAFRLGEEEYAIAIEHVREIVKAPDVTEVPRCPPHVAGVILVRGEVVTVQDPRRRLGLPGAPGAAARVIVCDVAGERVGLLVDAMSQVLRLHPQAIEAPSQGIASIDAEYIAGIGRDADHLYVLLDAEALMAGETARERPA
jgi:purine-binding chemotaxis protein CheW